MNGTTDAQFKKFKKNVEKRIKPLVLYYCEVGYHRQYEKEDSGNEWCTDITDRELANTAFHEVCEVLLLNLQDIASRRINFSAEDIEGIFPM